jgi:hypothetical protein
MAKQLANIAWLPPAMIDARHLVITLYAATAVEIHSGLYVSHLSKLLVDRLLFSSGQPRVAPP